MKRAWEAPLAPSAERFAVTRFSESEGLEAVLALDALARETMGGSGVAIQEELARPWSRIWVARGGLFDPGAPIAFLLAWHVADELHVLDVGTLPALRRLGVARAIMHEALCYARAEKIRVLLLEVRRSNVAAIRLYRGLGFTALGVRRGYYSDNGEDAVEMILGLDPETGRALPALDEIAIDG
ncbi:MAG: GNAT family N-acetyltransferase [Minicystis sp.]